MGSEGEREVGGKRRVGMRRKTDIRTYPNFDLI
jgi:hypothetical protein